MNIIEAELSSAFLLMNSNVAENVIILRLEQQNLTSGDIFPPDWRCSIK